MKTLHYLTGLIAALQVFPSVGRTQTATPEAGQRNVLFIFTDDQNHDWMGYRNPWVLTPNLDRVAAQGMTFEHGLITLPVCSPARAAALTGRHNLANGVVGYGTPPHQDEVSFAEHFREAGFLTALVGKWHIPRRDDPDLLDDFEVIRMQRGGFPYVNPTVVENGVEKPYEGYVEDYNADQSVAIIEQAQKEGRPFMIWLNPKTPHGHRDGYYVSDEVRRMYADFDFSDYPMPENFGADLDGKPEYLQTYRGRRRGPERWRPRNLFMRIAEMDRSLGRLFDALEAKDLMDSTYIVFMSDNGVFAGQHGFMSKGLLYEAAIRVPLFVIGPGIPVGVHDTSHVVSNVDIAPTMLDLVGLPIPEAMHGMSLRGVLTAEQPLEREFVFLEVPEAIQTLETQASLGLRSTRWKFIRTYEDGIDQPATFEELYDLEVDPWELSNVADDPKYRETLERLRAELDRKRAKFSQ